MSQRRCDRCGAEALLHRVAQDLLCDWCYTQWRELYEGEDEDGLLKHGPGSRFILQRAA
jgi:hypothetical protein